MLVGVFKIKKKKNLTSSGEPHAKSKDPKAPLQIYTIEFMGPCLAMFTEDLLSK